MFGIVKESIGVNVYAEPRHDAIVLCRVPTGTRLEVDFRQDIGKFCAVCTSTGIEGFCMKKHITVEH